MISLDDPKWRELEGGYGIRYDASVPLRQLEAGEDVWDELWEELHHQGDVGEASYAAVPHLVRITELQSQRDWNVHGLVSTIEIERHRRSSPPLPNWLIASYDEALQRLLKLALNDLHGTQDQVTLRSILGTVALVKKDLKFGALIAHTDEAEVDEMLDQYCAWSELYE